MSGGASETFDAEVQKIETMTPAERSEHLIATLNDVRAVHTGVDARATIEQMIEHMVKLRGVLGSRSHLYAREIAAIVQALDHYVTLLQKIK